MTVQLVLSLEERRGGMTHDLSQVCAPVSLLLETGEKFGGRQM